MEIKHMGRGHQLKKLLITMEGDVYYNTEETANWSGRLSSSQLCRICANPNGYLIPIFEGEGLDHELGMKIQKHLPIQVSAEDNLPKQMCYQCASTLISWHDLVISCLEADRKIRNLQKQEQEDEDEDDDAEDDKAFDDPIKKSDTAGEEIIEPGTSLKLLSEVQTQSGVEKDQLTSNENHLENTEAKTVAVKCPSQVTSPQQEISKSPKSSEITNIQESTSQQELIPSERFQGFHGVPDIEVVGEQNSGGATCNSKKCNSMYINPEEGLVCSHCSNVFTLRAELITHMETVHSDLISRPTSYDRNKHNHKHAISRMQDEIKQADGPLPGNTIVSCDSQGTPNPIDESYSPSENKIGTCNTKCDKAESNCKKQFPCTLCGKVLTRSFDLKRHMKIHSRPKSLSKYPNAEEMCVTDGDKNGFPCYICGRVLTRKFDLQRHVNTHMSKDKHVDALFTGAATDVSDDTNDAWYSNSDVKPVDPQPLNKTPKQTRKVTKGMFICSVCQKSFTRKFDLKRHTKQHSSEELSQNFPQKATVDYEAISRAKVFVDGRTLYRCDQCNKHLYTRASYIKHLRIHTGEKPFTCHVCGKQFRTSGLLNRHVQDVHEGIKKYPCDICGRKFAHKRSRNEHRRVHTGERPCVCHLCGKAFKTKASLYVHNKFHTDIFPHPCPQCDKQFRRKHHLNVHMLLHTGEKPHVCHICGKSFRLSKTLKDHVVIHTNKDTFECSICGKHFAQERYLKNHIRSHKQSKTNMRDNGDL